MSELNVSQKTSSGDRAVAAAAGRGRNRDLSTNAKLENLEAAFAGYGISSAELKYDDYAVSSAKDRVAVVLAGTPDGDNPHGQFARYEDARWKAIAARNAGAKALLIIAQEENLKEDRLARLRYDNSVGETGLPVAVISRKTAAGFFSSSGNFKQVLASLTEVAQEAGSNSAAITPAMISSRAPGTP